MSSTFVRREIWGLESATPFDRITLAYAKAIQVMQAKPLRDPTSWAYQGAIHAHYGRTLRGAPWNACQHQSWFFLSWHRMYLYYFERIVRKAVVLAGGPKKFALPYWNYDRPFPGNTLPIAFRTPTLPDGTANPLFIASPGRQAALMAGGQVPGFATSSTAAMAETVFSPPSPLTGFGGGRVGPAQFGGSLGALEQTPHNVMHPTIGGPTIGKCKGGLMTDPSCAALDPIFWLHHANIDRLWNNWIALGGGRANPTRAAWRNAKFEFRDENGAVVKLSGKDVVDTAAQLHYVYDDAAAFETATPRPPRRRPSMRPPELAAATDEPLVLAGSTESVTLSLPASSRELVESAAADDGRRVLVSVDDIEAEQDPGLAYAVFLNGAGDTREHIGNVSLFGIAEMNDPDRPHDGAPGFRHTFDATRAVAALREAGQWDPRSVRVTFEPIRLLPPPGESWTADLAESGPVAPVRIGRVSLFVA